MKKVSPFALGATLYMPATRTDLLSVVMVEKLQGLRSLVVCLEDAVSDIDLDVALANLEALLLDIDRRGGRPEDGPMMFVRPRNADMAAKLSAWPLMRHADGYVMPKLNLSNIDAWAKSVEGTNLYLLPTLETKEVFDPTAMVELRNALMESIAERIIALRIGGNDLMGCLGLRRPQSTTLYQTPMGYVIPMLAGVMGAAGFALTAPVFEQIHSQDLLKAELDLDMAHGLVGKTAIHPTQVPFIENHYRVDQKDLETALRILNHDAPGVFKLHQSMCEPATHRPWARSILDAARCFGCN